MSRIALKYIRPSRRARGKQDGFTLIELIVVLLVVGILAVAAIPRFADRRDFDSRGFFDASLAALRYAEKSAVAQRRSVCVTFTANSLTLTIDSAYGLNTCTDNLAGPNGVSPYTLAAPSGVSYTAAPTNFRFNPSGTASLAQAISVAGYSGNTINVATTGAVYEN